MAEMPPRNQFMQVSAAPHTRVIRQSLSFASVPFGLLGYKILSEARETDVQTSQAIHGIEDPCRDQKNVVALSRPSDYLPFGHPVPKGHICPKFLTGLEVCIRL